MCIIISLCAAHLSRFMADKDTYFCLKVINFVRQNNISLPNYLYYKTFLLMGFCQFCHS